MNPEDIPERKYQDFINFEPVSLKLLTQEEMQVAMKHQVIISALREKLLSVKEIHDLYIIETEEKRKTHSITQKSVYRYIEELENANIVMVGGFRKTEGIKSSERLYGRTGKTFYTVPDMSWYDPSTWPESERNYIQSFGKLLGIALGFDIDRFNEQAFEEFFKNYTQERGRSIEKLFSMVEDNKQLYDVLASMTLEQINWATENIQMIMPFITNPSFLDELKALYESS